MNELNTGHDAIIALEDADHNLIPLSGVLQVHHYGTAPTISSNEGLCGVLQGPFQYYVEDPRVRYVVVVAIQDHTCSARIGLLHATFEQDTTYVVFSLTQTRV